MRFNIHVNLGFVISIGRKDAFVHPVDLNSPYPVCGSKNEKILETNCDSGNEWHSRRQKWHVLNAFETMVGLCGAKLCNLIVSAYRSAGIY